MDFLKGHRCMHWNLFLDFSKIIYHSSRFFSEHPRNLQNSVEKNVFKVTDFLPRYCFWPIHQYELPRSSSDRIQNHSDLEANFTPISVVWAVSFFMWSLINRTVPVLLLDYANQFFHHFNELTEIRLEVFWKNIYLESKKIAPDEKFNESEKNSKNENLLTKTQFSIECDNE